MQCNCGADLVIKQEKLLRFYECRSCKRVLRKDSVLNTEQELEKARQKYGPEH